MASFQKYTTKQGIKWLYKTDIGKDPITGERKTTTRRGFKTKKEAIEHEKQLRQEIANGMMVGNDKLTYEDVFNQWFSNHSKTIKKSTINAIKSKFSRHIIPRFGKLRIKEITPHYCQKMINEIAINIKSVNDIKIQANQVFKYAVKMNIILKNPMEYVTIPKHTTELISEEAEQNKRNYWKKDELNHFLKIIQSELDYKDYVMFHLFIYTGARKGEILSLTWDDINLNSGSVRFNKTLFHDKELGNLFLTPKTRDSFRVISLDKKTISILKKWHLKQKELSLANIGYKNSKGLVLTRDSGEPIRLAYPNDKLSSLVKRYNLYPITIYGFRHTHASLLFEAGASIKEVQERLGHSDIQMTMNIYTHVTDTLKEQTANKFQQFLEV